ncbi:unnamed protein product [Scytosiphon promiscuus]
MFTGSFLESQQDCKVVIEDAEHKHLMVVLDYLYSGRIGLNDQNVMPVSALANRYEVLPLMAQCEGYMKWRLNPSNVCQHLLAAEEHRVPKAAALALDYLAVHFDEACCACDGISYGAVHHDSSGDFYSLGGDTVLHVLQHDGLTVDEETVFLAVDGWAKAWKRRQSIRGATPNYAVGRYPPQSVAESSETVALCRTTTANRDTSSSARVDRSARDTDEGRRRPPHARQGKKDEKDEKDEKHEKHEKRKDCSSVSSVNSTTTLRGTGSPSVSTDKNLGGPNGRGPSNMGSGRVCGGGGIGCSGDVMDTAVAGRRSRSTISSSNGSCANDGLPIPPFPVAANAAVAISAAAAAGAAAAARRNAEERQPTTAALSGLVTCFRGTHADEPGQSSPESTRPASPSLHPEARVVGVSGRDDSGDGSKDGGDLMLGGVSEKPRRGTAASATHRVLQRRASGSAAGPGGRREQATGGTLERAASFSHPPSPPEPSARSVRREDAVVVGSRNVNVSSSRMDAGADARKVEESSKVKMEAMDTMASMPQEERAFVDELLMEVRFPLISTRFLCQVVEKSPAMSGSRVAQRLLHEAYRFQAIRPDGTDVDDLFPGNHRVKYRGNERVLFGEGDGCIGTVDDYSSSLSEVHLVENVKRRDEKYWLPGQPEEAYFCVRLDRVRRITKFRYQNRYSEEFEVAVRRTRREEWQVIVPRQQSGGHKDVKELDLTRKRVKARHVKISLRGRKRSCYNTSCYWVELLGF